MSHLFKENKKILKISRFLLISFFLYIFFNTLFLYTGNKLVYLFFSVISFYLIVFSFRKKSIFFENFFGFFLLCGFWFKFSIILILKTSFTEGISGVQEISPKNFDDAIIASIIGILGFIIFGYVREFFFSYPTKFNININTKFYESNRKLILIFFLLVFASISFLNFYFQIYQKGLIGQSYNFIISGIVKTSLLYFLSLWSAIILYYEVASYKKVFIFIFLLVFLESFLSSVSMLSRGMVFNSFALVFAFYKLSNKIGLKVNYIFFLKISLILIFIFIISIFYINQVRINILSNNNSNNQNQISNINNGKLNYLIDNIFIFNKAGSEDSVLLERNISTNESQVTLADQDFIPNIKMKNFIDKSIFRLKHLLVHRWVGIDSMLLITKDKDKLSLDLFKESIKEKFDANSISFYERKFKIYSEDHYSAKSIRKGNTLPGLITFLFFSGSYIFLFFMMIFFSFIGFVIEYLMLKSSSNNLFAASLIGMVVSYRFAHFGYLPAQSYLLFGSILGIILMFFVTRFVNKIYSKTKNKN